MKSVIVLFAGLCVTLSGLGCCYHRPLCQDPCDPCGAITQGSGCRSWMDRKISKWRKRNFCRNHGACGRCGPEYGYDTGWDDCCESVMTPSCGSVYSSMMPSAGGCASCGSMGQMPAPMMQTAPSPAPEPAPAPAPTPPGTSPSAYNYNGTLTTPPVALPPVPPGVSYNSAPQGVQQVSYEEFVKLPGVIVNGPGAVPAGVVPAPAPMLSRSPAPLGNSAIQQAAWTSSR